jgi:hypothetical protein
MCLTWHRQYPQPHTPYPFVALLVAQTGVQPDRANVCKNCALRCPTSHEESKVPSPRNGVCNRESVPVLQALRMPSMHCSCPLSPVAPRHGGATFFA